MISKLCGLWILGKREQTKVREVSPQSQDNLLSAKFMSWIYERIGLQTKQSEDEKTAKVSGITKFGIYVHGS
jgi:hypothetical protein